MDMRTWPAKTGPIISPSVSLTSGLPTIRIAGQGRSRTGSPHAPLIVRVVRLPFNRGVGMV